ncbi:hypothetical protein BH10PSE3_BH10PSE3_16290 [soil metagenome]
MNKPATPVTVTLSPEDALDLGERVARGEFSSLDEALAAELAELNYRRAAEIMGGSEKLESFLDEFETEAIVPQQYAGAGNLFAEFLKKRRDTSRG